MSLGAQGECRRINAKVIQHESIIPRLKHEVEVSLQRVSAVISSVESKMGELEERMEDIKESNMNADIPSNVVNSLNDIIMEGAPSSIVDVLRWQVNDLTEVVCIEQFTTDDLRIELTGLQERFNATIQRSGASSLLPSSDSSLQTSNRELMR